MARPGAAKRGTERTDVIARRALDDPKRIESHFRNALCRGRNHGALFAAGREMAGIAPRTRPPPAIGGFRVMPAQARDFLDRRDQGFAYFKWCKVATHIARCSARRKSLSSHFLTFRHIKLTLEVTTCNRMNDKWFKQQQKKVSVTAADIAAVRGLDRSVISKIYNGKQRMSLDWAKAFAQVLEVPLADVLEHAGVADEATAQQLTPGFADGDATPFRGKPATTHRVTEQARIMGADRAGIDVWDITSRAMQLDGYMPGDHILLDTHQSEQCKAGDAVMAQVYDHTTGGATTIFRRYHPPVLVAASADPDDARVRVVDGDNVVIMGKVIASWRTS